MCKIFLVVFFPSSDCLQVLGVDAALSFNLSMYGSFSANYKKIVVVLCCSKVFFSPLLLIRT